jgi:hypothetical protein
MINEVKFSKYVDTNEFVEEINLDDFIRCNFILLNKIIKLLKFNPNHLLLVYINHRPAFGLDPYEIYNAFRIINNKYQNESESLPRHVFLEELQTSGEHMTEYELADCVTNLLHTKHQVDELSQQEISDLIDKHLPEEISVDKFMSEMVGIQTDDFDSILQTWEAIRQKNTAQLNQSKRVLSARSQLD